MLSKGALLNNPQGIAKTFNSKRIEGFFFTLFYSPSEYFRICVIVSKKVAKSSVKRNYMKRFIKGFFVKEFLYKNEKKDFFDMIFLVKKPFSRKNKSEVLKELEELCKSIYVTS
ncbi:ribonuclease P protein component [Thermodesulfobium acidiphilum]|uniref:Ribonuclease P protein component n=1 Tax=Thermodesulfobium acidiphilum TaxID=1794699 RepID=A0A2R4W397_THEAF|nr:ribonuclease P protein component [Thermodesulfobium acidiphilum]AWB11142.1 ribonuclease P protein component [Thermodesulfobium acidiphilum]